MSGGTRAMHEMTWLRRWVGCCAALVVWLFFCGEAQAQHGLDVLVLEDGGGVDASEVEAPRAPVAVDPCAGVGGLRDGADNWFNRLLRDGVSREQRAVLVALLPDGDDERIGYLHRGSEEAVVLAFEHAGYQLTARRDPQTTPTGDAGTVREDLRVGALVFRRASQAAIDGGLDVDHGGSPLSIVLLLVPERPDLGPDSLSLALALCATRDTGAPWVAGERTLVIGPTFSGSSAALRDALRARMAGVQTVVVNGAATGSAVREFLGHQEPAITLRSTTIPDEELEQRFYAHLVGSGMIAPDAIRPRRDGGVATLNGVAILKETGSGYGAAITGRDEEQARDATTRYDARDAGADVGVCAPPRWAPEFQLTFPLHVSQVRAAYERQDRLRHAHPESVDSPSVGRSNVLDPIALEDGDTGQAAMLLSQDVGLNQMLAESAHQGVRFLGVEATDPADVVFLARRVHDVAPDVRLFVLQGDHYYLHPSFRRDMLGTFVVTPYPFLGSNVFDARRSNAAVDLDWDHHFAFANSGSEGIHNAVAYAMGLLMRDRTMRGMLVEYMPFRCAGDERGRDLPRDAGVRPMSERLRRLQAPPVWISVIGNTGISPLAVVHGCWNPDHPRPWLPNDLAHISPTERYHACREKDVDVRLHEAVVPPRFTAILLLVLAAFALFYTARELYRTEEVLAVKDAGTRWRSYFWFLSFESGILAAVLLDLIYLQHAALNSFRTDLGLPLLALTVGLLGILCTLYMASFGIVRLIPRADDDTTNRYWNRSLAAVFFVMLSLVLLATWRIRSHMTAEFDEHISTPRLFALRALPLLNGVTPMSPMLMLLASLFWCAYTRRKRVLELLTYWQLAEAVPSAKPPPDEARATSLSVRIVAALRRWSDRFMNATLGMPPENRLLPFSAAFGATPLPEEEALHATQARFFISEAHMVGLLLIWAAPAAVVWVLPIYTIETWLIRVVLMCAVVVTGALGTATVVRLAVHWQHLEPLLRRIDTHPVGGAFSRLPKRLSERVEQQLSQNRDDLTRMAVCIEAFREALLVWSASDVDEASRPFPVMKDWWFDLKKLEGKLAMAREQAASPGERDHRVALGRDVFLRLLAVSRNVTKTLSECWWSGVVDVKATKAIAEALEVFVASVLTVLIHRQVRPIRWYFVGAVGMAVPMMFALSAYPFRPRSLVLLFLWITVVTVSGTTLSVYVQMDRNALLSRIAGTTPGRTSYDLAFFSRVFTLGVVPVLSLLAAQFPQIVRIFYDTLTPFARLLR